MNVPNLRSPRDMIGGLVYFGRMLDKIRLHAQGKLPADYHANFGKGFDGRVCSLLHVNFEDVIARVNLGGEDIEILQWCFDQGRKPTDEEMEIWNNFMRKRGWRDDASDRLALRIKELGPQWHGKIHTFFDLIDADEGRG
jgi:uncharacterized protein DUF5069